MSTDLFPTPGNTLAETYARAVEPEPSVTITDATFFGHGWQPTTIAVLQAIWFMPQGVSFGVDDLATWFGRLGWRSVNGRPFGVEGVRRELGLIRKAGYIQANRLRGDGGKVTGIRYEVSKRARTELQPAEQWIPIQGGETQKPSSDHVPLPTGDGGQPDEVGGRTRRSHHVPSPAEHGGQPQMVAGPFPQVAPCAVGNPNPPHPPGEVDTSSPNPHKQAAAPTGEEAERFTPEQIRDAEQFLQLLPTPWAAGRQTAKAQAPKLLAAADEQGWQLDDQLAAQLTANPTGVNNYPAVLKTRIADLPLHAAIHRSAPATFRPTVSPLPLPVWCEDLDCDEDSRLRCITDDRGYRRTGPCPACHPDTQTQEAA